VTAPGYTELHMYCASDAEIGADVLVVGVVRPGSAHGP
jgi:hypothetical protein